MGKRIVRIFPEDFEEKLILYVNKELQVILKDRSVFKVNLLVCSADKILVENKIKNKKSIPLGQISEIQIDDKSTW